MSCIYENVLVQIAVKHSYISRFYLMPLWVQDKQDLMVFWADDAHLSIVWLSVNGTFV